MKQHRDSIFDYFRRYIIYIRISDGDTISVYWSVINMCSIDRRQFWFRRSVPILSVDGNPTARTSWTIWCWCSWLVCAVCSYAAHIIISWMNRDVPFDNLLGHCSCCDCATLLAFAERSISSRPSFIDLIAVHEFIWVDHVMLVID